MEVSVSEEALIKIRGALNRFKVDMSGSAVKIARMADERIALADSCMMKIHREIEVSEKKVKNLEKELAWLNDKINDLEKERAYLEHEIENLQYRINQIQGQIAALESQIANCSGKEDKKTAARNKQLQSEIAALRAEIVAIQSQINAKSERLRGVYTEIEQFTAKRNRCQAELEKEQSWLAKLREKERWMREAYGQMKRDLEEYVMAAKRFEDAAVDMVHGKRNALDQCIYYVEQYLSQNL